MRRSLILLALLSSACGSSSPTTPTPLTPLTPVTYTVSGTVTATNGGQALSGLSVDLNGQAATTNGAGSFTYALTSGTTARLQLAGATIVPRSLLVNVAAARTVPVGAIALGGGFDLTFYRELVRDSLESPSPQPLRRWTTSPNVYLQESPLANGATLDLVERVARESISQWTNGTLAIASVERGTGTRAGQAGWLTVLFAADSPHCGLSDVGLSGGTVTLYPSATCGCDGLPVRPAIVRHEVGHAMGFYHTDAATDVMIASTSVCDKPISARELLHAAIAYARPVGNTDPDTDPVGTVALRPMTVR